MIRPHQFIWIGGLSFLLGVAVATRFYLPTLPLILAVGLVLGVLCFRPPSSIQAVGVFVIALLLGWWRCQTVLVHSPALIDLHQQSRVVVGQIANDPVAVGNQQRFMLAVATVDEQHRSFKVWVTAWHLPAFHYADTITGKLQFALPTSSADFDYANYLAKDNIYLTATQAGELHAQPSPRPTFLGALYHAKHWVADAIHRFLPEPHSSLLAGLLLGIKTDLSDSFRLALKNSGTSHIVALSGFNVTIIITFLLFMLRTLPRRFVWILSSILILGFVVMTGAASSVVRAAIMGWVLLLAGLWGRRHSATTAILLAACLMVGLHPLILFYDVGFQLSLAATAGILYGSTLLTLSPTQPLIRLLTETLFATIGATIFTLPLIALYFGGISWVTLGANLIIVPLIPYVMLVGCLGLVGFLLWPALQWLSLLVWPLSALVFNVINWFGNLPTAFVPIPALPVWVPLGYYLVLAVIIIYINFRRHEISRV